MPATVEFYVDESAEHRWRVRGENGEVVATGEGHTRRLDAVRAFKTAATLMTAALLEYMESQ